VPCCQSTSVRYCIMCDHLLGLREMQTARRACCSAVLTFCARNGRRLYRWADSSPLLRCLSRKLAMTHAAGPGFAHGPPEVEGMPAARPVSDLPLVEEELAAAAAAAAVEAEAANEGRNDPTQQQQQQGGHAFQPAAQPSGKQRRTQACVATCCCISQVQLQLTSFQSTSVLHADPAAGQAALDALAAPHSTAGHSGRGPASWQADDDGMARHV
jgi:hypothetical protein